MSKSFIQNIVIFLGILIIIAFFALIYGMYSKISTSGRNLSNLSINHSFNLDESEEIKNIEVLDNKNLFILIEKNDNLIGAIYNVEDKKIIQKMYK